MVCLFNHRKLGYVTCHQPRSGETQLKMMILIFKSDDLPQKTDRLWENLVPFEVDRLPITLHDKVN